MYNKKFNKLVKTRPELFENDFEPIDDIPLEQSLSVAACLPPAVQELLRKRKAERKVKK